MTLSAILALPPKYVIAYFFLGISVCIYTALWLWGIVHAASTPKSTVSQRAFWAGSMFVNPVTAVWYWYIWKRWAFWLLFTPLLVAFGSLPFVTRSLLTNAEASQVTNTLFALGTQRQVVVFATLMVFPLILRLAALLHLGRNTELTAMDRNDWVVSLALPIFGFGAGMAYCAKYRRGWAMTSLVWWVGITISSYFLFSNITKALIPAGEERREIYRNASSTQIQ